MRKGERKEKARTNKETEREREMRKMGWSSNGKRKASREVGPYPNKLSCYPISRQNNERRA